MSAARRYFIAGVLAVFCLNPLIPFAGEEKEQLKTYKFKSDLFFQIQEWKNLRKDRKETKIGPRLNRYIAQQTADKVLLEKFSATGTEENRDRIRIIIDISSDIDPILDRIKSYDARVIKERGNLLVIEIPVNRIEAMIAEVDGIKHARLPLRFFKQDVTSEGVAITGANNFHNIGFTGAGVKVAVIDVGFKGLTDAQLSGDIPNNVQTYDFTLNGIETQYYHGTACAEIVHDMAPQAELHLLKISDEIDMYDALDYCMNNDIDIISLSISTYGSGPGDGTGPLDEAFDEAVEGGILVVASAGNFGNRSSNGNVYGRHWKGEFYDSDEDDIHEFVAGDSESFYNMLGAVPDQDDDGNPETSEVTVIMRWNDDWAYADIDYDIALFDNDTNELVASSESIQEGSQPPLEEIFIDLPDSEDYMHYYSLVVSKKSGEPVGTELELFLGGTSRFVPVNGSLSAIATSPSSITEPSDAESVLSVGAIDYMNWETGPQEDFSSQGPTNAWSGSSPRIKPDIIGPDGTSGNTLGTSSFSGTSAAVPHVAGAAALILSMYPDLNPDELKSYIESNAVDMGETGKDNYYGWGKLNMEVPIVDEDGTANVTSNTGDGGGGGCFIATAAFGSPMESHVKILREFRDHVLIKSRAGKIFVDYYYSYSPPIAGYIAKHEILQALVRCSLLPLVWASWLVLRLGLIEVLTFFTILFAIILVQKQFHRGDAKYAEK